MANYISTRQGGDIDQDDDVDVKRQQDTNDDEMDEE